ncbi:YozE family protein [Listeria sp. PSOL-1]|uniref:YozE family protein n=1 Tax=Listeria sp. PSOL-1 TaxID=1844999 RepID=UPI0013D6D2AA|nr:YozE family protein [Listeria sp. PSOL-1]
MGRSFYHFLMTYRDHTKNKSAAQFADDAYHDHSFPKQAKDYHTLSNYLELNAHYLPGMSIFDDLWNKYLEDEAKNK